jgi:hypothetical protein
MTSVVTGIQFLWTAFIVYVVMFSFKYNSVTKPCRLVIVELFLLWPFIMRPVNWFVIVVSTRAYRYCLL